MTRPEKNNAAYLAVLNAVAQSGSPRERVYLDDQLATVLTMSGGRMLTTRHTASCGAHEEHEVLVRGHVAARRRARCGVAAGRPQRGVGAAPGDDLPTRAAPLVPPRRRRTDPSVPGVAAHPGRRGPPAAGRQRFIRHWGAGALLRRALARRFQAGHPVRPHKRRVGCPRFQVEAVAGRALPWLFFGQIKADASPRAVEHLMVGVAMRRVAIAAAILPGVCPQAFGTHGRSRRLRNVGDGGRVYGAVGSVAGIRLRLSVTRGGTSHTHRQRLDSPGPRCAAHSAPLTRV